MSYTQGPWELESDSNNTEKWIFSKHTGDVICRFEHDELNITKNSQMISAAPEMLSFLNNLYLSMSEDITHRDEKLYTELINVLNKAMGI